MIDIHAHILYGLDDGAQDLATSRRLAELAQSAGTTDIVATPHSDSQYSYVLSTVEERRAELQALVGEGIRIHRGCDFHLSYDNIRRALESPETYTINGLGYLLVEFSDLMIASSTERIFGELRQAGCVPIVTHPERNPHLSADIPRLRRWVERGNYLQITAQSVLGQFGGQAQRCSLKLLDEGLAHFVASDGHDPVRRPTRLDLVSTFLTERYGAEYRELLLEIHPKAVIDGRPLDPGPLVRPREQKRKWYQFWG